ncbi:hypothetical protein G6F36_014359 [Rhizopus arrhizus]|nr:hypothetical protein G6F36_014359 [Rhizopus arrhizus]
MSRFKKKAQRFTYSFEEPQKNIAPSFRVTSTNKRPTSGDVEPRPSTKRARKERKQEDDSLLLNALKEELQKRLVQKVADVLEKNENVEGLKNTLLMAKRLERGMVTEAEKSYDYPSGTIEKYIKRNSKQKKGYQYWVDHVNEMFDIILSQVQGQSAVRNLSKSASSEFSDLATPESSVPTTPSHLKEIFASHRNLEPTRAFTAHINQIIRKDLEPEIKDHFIDVLKNAHVDVSDYISIMDLRCLICSFFCVVTGF